MELPAARKVFISYVQEDGAVAEQIAAGLEARGFSTWYYQRDCKTGNYLLATREAIEQCEAFVLFISPRSIVSEDVTIEVVRALKSHKKKFPLLLEISYEKFESDQPEWAQALGASAASLIPRDDPQSIIPALVTELKRVGLQADLFGGAQPPAGTSTSVRQASVASPSATPGKESRRVMLLYKRNARPDEDVLKLLDEELTAQGHQVFIDRHMKAGTEWPLELEKQVRSSYAVVPLLSAAAVDSDMLAWEVQTAYSAARKQNGEPHLIPVRVNFDGPMPDTLADILNPIQYVFWKGVQDNAKVVAEISKSLQKPPEGPIPWGDSGGGAVALSSEFYIERPADQQFRYALQKGEGVLLIKGARQMGKTSLLARVVAQAKEKGFKTVVTDFQKLNEDDLGDIKKFYFGLAALIVRRLKLEVDLEKVWRPGLPANLNFETFMEQEVLAKVGGPLLWGMDEVDRLFTCSFGGEVFGLLRSWFNDRSLDEDAPWKNLTMVIAYATEAHLFIRDINMSPFNIGTILELQDFTIDQVDELNRRYGKPLRDPSEVQRFYKLIGGSPFLVRRGFQELATRKVSLDEFENTADRDEGPYGDHLRRIIVMVAKDASMQSALREILSGNTKISEPDLVRLRSGGVLAAKSASSDDVCFRCQIYEKFLRRHLN